MSPRIRRLLLSALLASSAAISCPAAETVAPAAAPAQDFASTLAEVRKLVGERITAINTGAEVPNRFDWTALDGQLAELPTDLPKASAQDAKNQLRGLSGNLKSDEAKALVARLVTAFDREAKTAETARQAAFEKKVTALSEAALAAKKAEDIDPLFEQLEALQQEANEQQGPRQSRNHNLINRQQNFLNAWQTLLIAAADGDSQGVRNAASNLGSGSYARAHGVGNAAVRARVRELSAAARSAENEDKDLLDGLTLENLSEVQDRLASANESIGWNHSGNKRQQIISTLDQLRTATLALEAGDTDLALRSFVGFGIIHDNRQSDSFVRLHRLRAAWLERSLPALTGLKDIAARGEKEFPEPYLRRLILAADAARDQPRALALARVLRRVEPRMNGSAAPASDDLAGAYENYAAGQRLEAAGQTEAAADSYRAAIVAGAPAGLSAMITERLKTLAQTSEKKS